MSAFRISAPTDIATIAARDARVVADAASGRVISTTCGKNSQAFGRSMFAINEATWRPDVRCPDCGRMGLEFEGCVVCPDDACDVVEIAPVEMRLSAPDRAEGGGMSEDLDLRARVIREVVEKLANREVPGVIVSVRITNDAGLTGGWDDPESVRVVLLGALLGTDGQEPA
ncbi:MAG: hypothetical protein IPL76_10570 [Gemmatimonadetes bacterium]|nr:hypothetical protein [Gemmatimonadota bacterium]